MVLETYRLLQLVLEADRATVIAELDALVPRVLALEPSSFKVDALTPLAVVAMTIGEVGRARTLAGSASDSSNPSSNRGARERCASSMRMRRR